MTAIKNLRSLLREIRHTSSAKKLAETPQVQYLMSQYRKYQTTDEQLCKMKSEMNFLSETYHCYLRSMRNYKEINSHYKGAGERSVADTASMVGFKLPHDPK
jgi:hypothetical protein